jgi:hypothetical protein
MRSTAVAVILTLIISSGVGWFAWNQTSEANDATGCEGLADYRVAMFKIGRAYLKALDEDGIPLSRDSLTYSTEEWTTFAEDTLQFQRDLTSINPPVWASSWHELQVERTSLQAQLAKAIATAGISATAAFADHFNANDAERDTAIEAISQTCRDFAAFTHDWSALDGEIDGTPVATPAA